LQVRPSKLKADPLISGRSSVIMRVMEEIAHTIPAFFARAVARYGDQPALGFIRNGELHWRTWQQVFDEVAQKTSLLSFADIEPGDRVAHVSENRYEWVITDLAIHLVGAVHVPIHVTLSGEQIAEQIADCGARLVIVSSRKLLSTFVDRIPADVEIRLHDEDDEQGKGMESSLLGKPAVVPAANVHRPGPDDLASILYTSGTTGRPRGVMLSQRNLATNAATMADAFRSTDTNRSGTDFSPSSQNVRSTDFSPSTSIDRSTDFSPSPSDGLKPIPPEQSRLCLLPLSHIYARTCDLYTWVYRGSRLILAESRETLARDLQLAKPTVLNAVPFVYQRIADLIRASGCPDEAAALRHFFGGRIESLACGGAALAPSVEAWYAEQRLPILCGYGLTEASPVIAASTPASHRTGSVGWPLPGVEVRLADDGEVLARGPNIMLGYWQAGDSTCGDNPVRDGWLHTGDLGEIDADGFLFIRGRKKELIVLSTGKKVSPTRVENLLTTSPLIEQAAIFGDGQPALSALIVPADVADREAIAAEIARCLASAAHEEQVRDFAILDRPFTIERGELTPKMSLCRNVLARNFAAELNAMAH
jgi:long-chain acyl-CoA synthetase